MNNLSVSIDYINPVNYTLCHNHIPICRYFEIINNTGRDLENIQIHVSGDYLLETSSIVYGLVKNEKSLKISKLDITLNDDELLNLSENVVSSIEIKITSNDETVYRGGFELDIMSYDYWLGTNILPQCLASFSMPDQSAINNIILRSVAKLQQISGSSAFIGYQDGNSQTVRKQIAAIFATFQEENIQYKSTSANTEILGQRITFADQLLERKSGDSIELTLLMASALESVGIYSGIVFTKGHVFLAIWVDELCSQHSVLDDVSFIRKKCSDEFSEMTIIDCVEITRHDSSFEKAQEIAMRHILDADDSCLYVDIMRCRLEGIHPLPARINDGGRWLRPIGSEDHTSNSLMMIDHAPYDLTKTEVSQKSKFDLWESKLLDFSLRNTFLNLSFRSRVIQLISIDAGNVEDCLQEDKVFSVRPFPDDIEIPNGEVLVRSFSKDCREIVKRDLQKNILYTARTDDDYANVMRNIYNVSNLSLEETGSNPLYLAIGLLKWYEKGNSPKPRYAPILLLPVTFVRSWGYKIKKRDEEISLNMTLFEYLRQIFGITVSGLDPLPTDAHGVDVNLIFDRIREVIKKQSRWEVLNECVLGTFSFNKFMMWKDLHSNRDKLLENSVVSSLVNGSLTWTPQPLTANLSENDRSIPPESMSVPLSVDSSQMAAVLEAGKGSTFILYGPPGTGKSQTIANIISNALYKGKRVLFVAEKMAALNVVQNRLEKIGLGPFCLELHSNKVTRKHILNQLEKALLSRHIRVPENSLSEQLYEKRQLLIWYLDSLHNDKGRDGFSLYECICEYDAHDTVAPLDIKINTQLSLFGKEQLDTFKEELYKHLPAIVHKIGQPSQHPLKEIRLRDGVETLETLTELLQEGCKISSDFVKHRSFLVSCFGESLADTKAVSYMGINLLSRVFSLPFVNRTVIDTVFDDDKCMELSLLCVKLKEKDSLYDELASNNKSEILEEDVMSLLNEWSEIKSKWFLPRYFASNNFLKKLSCFNKNINKGNVESVLNKILYYQKLSKHCSDHEHIIKEYTNQNLNTEELSSFLGELPDLKDCIDALSKKANIPMQEICSLLKDAIGEGTQDNLKAAASTYKKWEKLESDISEFAECSLPEDDFSTSVHTLFSRWNDNVSKLKQWQEWYDLRGRFIGLGLDTVIETIETEIVDPKSLADSFIKGLFKILAEQKMADDPSLAAFDGDLFDQQVEMYKELTSQYQELSKMLLYERLSSKIPQVYYEAFYDLSKHINGLVANGEVGLLAKNIRSGARGMTVRQLLESIPNLFPRICPCLLMSPMSVAQYIDLNQEKFDLVIFDEASQMPTCEAIGAIARGKSLIVVGDPRQMPPTSYFSVNSSDEYESIEDSESILKDCQELGIPSLQLNWHYRSQHESLIAFSNNEYYDGNLITFPSTDDQNKKVKFVKVDGIYEKGGTRFNKAEAEAIVNEVIRRLRNEELRKDSIGIISFSTAQQSLIEDILKVQINKYDLKEIAESMYEPIFVKNLENVQGDERDIILFSIGYGPDAKGKISMNFGPLNRDGGERRLNVAVSRARKEMMVYSTLTGSQINLNNTKSKGVEGLKHFLEYAENGVLYASRKNHYSRVSPIAFHIAQALANKGFEVETGVGLSDFKIDVAVKDPRNKSNYLLGILLDGDVYRNTQTTRDREIVQPEILKHLKWNVVRVWSVSWFNDPVEVISRLVSLLTDLQNERAIEDTPIMIGSSDDVVIAEDFRVPASVILPNPKSKAAAYPDIDNYIVSSKQSVAVDVLDEVVKQEQPIMFSLLCKRIATLSYMQKVSSNLREEVSRMIESSQLYQEKDRDNIVVCTDKTLLDNWDSYRPNNSDSANKRSIEDIPSVELEVVLLEVVEQTVSIEEDGLILIAAKRMGFARRGANVDSAFQEALQRLNNKGKLVERNGKLICRQMEN